MAVYCVESTLGEGDRGTLIWELRCFIDCRRVEPLTGSDCVRHIPKSSFLMDSGRLNIVCVTMQAPVFRWKSQVQAQYTLMRRLILFERWSSHLWCWILGAWDEGSNNRESISRKA